MKAITLAMAIALLVIGTVLNLTVMASIVSAADYTFEWDAHAENELVVKYRVYISETPDVDIADPAVQRFEMNVLHPFFPGQTINDDENPLPSEVRYTVTGLPGALQYAVCTAVDYYSKESGKSNEVAIKASNPTVPQGFGVVNAIP